MKKLIVTTAAIVVATAASYAQGLVSINSGTAAIIYTNGATSGKASISGRYAFELLISADTSLPGSASNITSSATFALWSDTGVTGANGFGLSAGRINSGTSVAAAGWTAPGATYDNARSVLLVGWDLSQYANWAALSTALSAGTLADGTWIGTTVIGVNVAGGGSAALNAVNLWGNQTGTPGYGWPSAVNNVPNLIMTQYVATPVPEPSTIALAGLGGLALLALRRKK